MPKREVSLKYGPSKKPSFIRSRGDRKELGAVTGFALVDRQQYNRLVEECRRQECTLTELMCFYLEKSIGGIIADPSEPRCMPPSKTA